MYCGAGIRAELRKCTIRGLAETIWQYPGNDLAIPFILIVRFSGETILLRSVSMYSTRHIQNLNRPAHVLFRVVAEHLTSHELGIPPTV